MMPEYMMRRRGVLKKYLSVGLVLIFALSGTAKASSSENDTSSFYKFTSSNVGRVLAELTLVGLQAASKARALTNVTTTTTTTVAPVKAVAEVGSNRAGRAATSTFKRSSKDLPQKQTTASNALLANIDFLTQLTNSKQDKNAEIDPLKCFPKALCGLSAESAAITRRRKNSLITDYIRLMKAVALNPSVMERTLKKLNRHEDFQQDDVGEDSDSDEDGEDDEEEDRVRSHSNHDIGVNRRSYGYGYSSGKTEQTQEMSPPTKKRTKRKESIPKDSGEFTKQFLQERAQVERLMDDGFNNEDTDATNWWAYEKEQEDPSLEALVDDSGTALDSSSRESYYTFGSKKRKPLPPIPPPKPDAPQQPQAPGKPLMAPPGAPPLPNPPPTPLVRMPENLHDSQSSSSSTISTIGRFFRNLFGFGGFSQDRTSFSRDPFFEGFKRSMPDGTPTIVTVDKTKEILTTAIEIGETLRSPNQCNSLFNGCQYQYIELLHVIDDIRRNLVDKGREDYETSQLGYEDNDDEIDEGSSYGYKSSLSKVSQAETLSPDYTAAFSKITGKNQKRNKKKKGDPNRDGKIESMSKESSVEIGSDEPTLFGSGQQNFDFVRQRHGKHGLNQNNHHHHHIRPHYPHQSSESQYPYYSQSYHSPYGHPTSYDDMFVRQPKTIWTTILSWFGFRRRK